MKILKWTLIVLVILALVFFGLFKWAQSNTKQHSPEDLVSYEKGNTEIEIFYNRPYKKEREIFGGLVPYGEVWRTGANEATTFATTVPLNIKGDTLAAGTYTLWTIPGASEWTVIFNEKMYSWGVGFDQEPSREAEFDVLQVNVPVTKTSKTAEQFTISFQDAGDVTEMLLVWDDVKVAVPLQPIL